MDNKSKMIGFRVDEDRFEVIKKAAEIDGGKLGVSMPISAYIRRLIEIDVAKKGLVDSNISD